MEDDITESSSSTIYIFIGITLIVVVVFGIYFYRSKQLTSVVQPEQPLEILKASIPSNASQATSPAVSTSGDSISGGSTPSGSTPSGSTPSGSTPSGSTSGGSTSGGSTSGGSTPKVVTETPVDYAEKICKTENKLPCKPNFSSVLVKDEIFDKEVNCCVVNDNRNDKQIIDNFMLACKQVLIDIKSKLNLDGTTYLKGFLVSNSKNEYNIRLLTELIQAIAVKQKNILDVSVSNAFDRLLATKTVSNIQKALTNIVQNKDTIIQNNYSSFKNKLVELKDKNPPSVGLTVNDWESISFDSYNAKVDYLSKDIQDTTFLKEYSKMRDLSIETLNAELKKNNLASPFIISPLSKLKIEIPSTQAEISQQNVPVVAEKPTVPPEVEKFASVPSNLPNINLLIEQVVMEYCLEYINMIYEKIPKELIKLSETEILECSNKLFIEAINYFNQKEGSEYIDLRLCNFVNGSYAEGSCSYKDKEACDNAYNWEDIKGANTSDQIYTEFKDGKCILSNPIARRICEDHGLTYDSIKQQCEITPEFCAQKSLKSVNTSFGPDCQLPFNSDMFTLLFTSRLIESVNNQFNSKNYKECKSGDFDSSNVSKETDKILNSSLKLESPFNIPAVVYKMNPKKSCVSNIPCSETQELKDGLCVEKCKPGFKSEGNKCYKLYSGYDVEAFGDIDPITGTGASSESGSQSSGAVDPTTGTGGAPTVSENLTYDVLSEMYGDTPKQEVKSEMKLLPERIVKRVVSNKPGVITHCGPDKVKENLLCYDKCRDGFKSDGALLCYKQYPDFEKNGQLHTITSVTKKITLNTGKPLSYCDPDKSKENLLCYDKCRDGFKSDGAVLCYKQYPEFEGNGQLHTITSITKKITTNTGKPLSFCDPDKSKENLLCYDKCRDGFSSDGALLCYRNPPQNWPGTTSLTHLQHKTIYSGPGKPLTTCNADQDKDGALCYPKCKPDHKGVGPVCWGNCPPNTTDVGLLCRNKCDPGYNEVAGVCWEIPPPGTVDVGALIRNGCDAGWYEVAGVCWENTPPGAVNVGALIREGCNPGYKDVAGVCWGSCPAGWNDDGAICREPMRWDSCSWRGAYGECVGGLKGGALKAKHSYVPTTRARKSYVPATRPKKSYVPATNPKPSYGRGAGEPLKCEPGLEQRGALCYENCAKHNANGIEYERRGDNIDFCSTKCPPGFKNIGIGGCEKEMYNRGVGKPMKCQPGQKQIGALCYEPCPPGTTMNTEGLCSQDCPPGSKDFGVGCTREAYNRGIGKPMKCQPGQQQITALCYDPCPPGTSMNTEGLCAQDCPPGSKDFGVGCTREAYNRGIGKPMGCKPNEVQKGALCYTACPPGMVSKDDNTCRQVCPPGTKDTGDTCERESYDKKTSVLPYTTYIRERLAPYINK